MADIGSLVANLELRSARFQSGIKNANRSLRTLERSAQTASRILGGVFGAVAARGLAGFVGEAVKAQAEMGRLRDRIGVSTEALSAFKFQAEASDVSFKTFTMGLQRFIRRTSEAAQGTGEARDALKTLGVSAQELARMAPEQAFLKVADALDQVENSGQRVQLAMKLFDSEGVALLQTMKGGSAAFRAAADEAARLGAVVSNDMANSAIEARSKMDTLSLALEGIQIQLANALLPTIQTVAEAFADGLPVAIEIVTRSLNMARAVFAGFVSYANKAVEGILRIVSKVADFLPGVDGPSEQMIQGFRDAAREWAALADAYEKSAIEGERARKATDGFGESVNKLAPKLRQSNAELGKAAKSADKLADEFNRTRDAVDDWKDSIRDVVTRNLPEATRRTEEFEETIAQLQLALKMFPEDAERIKSAIANVTAEFEKAGAAAKKTTATIKTEVPEAFKNAASGLQNSFRDLFRDMFDGVEDGFRGFVDRMIDGFKDMLAELAALAATRSIVIPMIATVAGGSVASGVADGLIGGVGDSIFGGGGGIGSSIFKHFGGEALKSFLPSLFAPSAAASAIAFGGGPMVGLGAGVHSVASGGLLGGLGLGGGLALGIGALGLGALLGGGLKGLFEGGAAGDFPFARVQFNPKTGQIGQRFEQDRGDIPQAEKAVQVAIQRIKAIEAQFGLEVVKTMASIGSNVNRPGSGLPTGFFAGIDSNTGAFGGPTFASGLGSIEEAINAVVARSFGAANMTQLEEMIEAIEEERRAALEAAAALIDAANETKAALLQEIETRTRALENLEELRLRLLGDSSTSPMNATERFDFFESRTRDIAAAAIGGDLEALQAFPQAVADFLAVGQDSFASVGVAEAGEISRGLTEDVMTAADERTEMQLQEIAGLDEEIKQIEEEQKERLESIAADTKAQLEELEKLNARFERENAAKASAPPPTNPNFANVDFDTDP